MDNVHVPSMEKNSKPCILSTKVSALEIRTKSDQDNIEKLHTNKKKKVILEIVCHIFNVDVDKGKENNSLSVHTQMANLDWIILKVPNNPELLGNIIQIKIKSVD